MQVTIAYQVIENLWRMNRIFCSSDYDESLKFLQTILPFKIHEYQTTSPYKGWVIPPKWDLVKGVIKKDGKTIFEVDHPLKIIGLSLSFTGTVSCEELQKHLHYDHRDNLSIPYHFRQHYRPWERNWGFCVSKAFYDSLEPGEYQVEIITKESQGILKVAEYEKVGDNKESLAFVAHLDHPGMANDDLSGVAVGVELFHKIAAMKTKFTYRLVIVQEIIGSVFYLDKTADSNIIESCFLEMLGSATPLALQKSREEKSCIEELLENNLSLSSGPFRSIICNDEVVWESHHIPMCTLTRYPYQEYHSDRDNLNIISKDSLASSVSHLYEVIKKFEKKILIKRNFEGLYSLAHPDYDLYIDPGQPAFAPLTDATLKNLRALMDEMPLLPNYKFVDQLAKDVNLPEQIVLDYLKGWQKKHLLTLI